VVNYGALPLNVANGIVIPVDQDAVEGDDLLVRAHVSPVHVVIDVTGYFSPLTLSDGPGSGIDADTLDGLQAGDLALAGHQHAGEDVTSGTVAEARIDAALTRDSEVISRVLAGDGAGSGIDADLLDGLHASAFQRKYSRVATVAKDGTGDYDDPVTAMNNLSSWCPGSTRCLLRIMAGVYNLSAPLVTANLVDVEGSGAASTVLVKGGSSDADDPNLPTVIANGGAEIRDLAIVSSGSDHALGVLLSATTRTLRDVYVSAQSSNLTATAVRITNSAQPTLEDCYLTTFGPAPLVKGLEVTGTPASLVVVRRTEVYPFSGAAADCIGIELSGPSQFELFDPRVVVRNCATGVAMSVRDGSFARRVTGGSLWAHSSSAGNVGLQLTSSGSIAVYGTRILAGSTGAIAVDNSGGNGLSLVRVDASGATGLRSTGGSETFVFHSLVYGSATAVSTASGDQLRVGTSQLAGTVTGAGNHKCVGAFDDDYDPLDTDCLP
jgi:hypothetical protein